MRARDVFDLLRVPNVTTAVGDVLAAGILATGGRPGATGETWGWVAAMLASACLYASGMALNDAVDAPRDAQQRPERPIPSGRVTRRFAATLAVILGGAGLSAAARAGAAPLLCACALAAAIAAYDLFLSGRHLIGPAGMAACRALNFTMGLLVFGPPHALGWAAVLVLATYVLGVTHLSLGEAAGSARRPVATASRIVAVAMLGAAVAGWRAGAVRSLPQLVALVVPLALLGVVGARALLPAWRAPRPDTIGPAVGVLVSGILWLDAGLAMATAVPGWLLPFAMLAGVQALLRRTFPVT